MGLFGKKKSKSKSYSRVGTLEQLQTGKDFGKKFVDTWLSGKNDWKDFGATKYEGQLPGTAGPTATQQSLFDNAARMAGQLGKYSTPEDWERRTQERVETRRRLMQPQYEAEDAALKEKMANMGLTHSSDALKKEADIHEQRLAQEDAFAQNAYDTYERLGLEVTPQAMESIGRIGEQQRSIEEMGLAAEFNEWLRTQPEYDPMIQQMYAYLTLPTETYSKGKNTQSGGEGFGMVGSALGNLVPQMTFGNYASLGKSLFGTGGLFG